MRAFLIFFVAFISYSVSVAQQSNIVLDSLSFVMANVQDNYDINPLPIGHPEYKEPRVDLMVVFKISNVSNLKFIDIVFEKEKNKKDFKLFKLKYVISDGKSYLTIGNRFYPIENGRVIIREYINSELMRRKIYFKVTATDQQNNSSNTLARDFN